MKIGALARHAGTTAPTIRYYEEIGLLPRPGRVADSVAIGPRTWIG
ncbi:MAG: MerR family DNA-binding transcriptional regulator [Pseudomonadota bacterium]